MRNIYDFSLAELEEYFVSIGEKKFRATQVYDFLYKKRVDDVLQMSNIIKDIKEHLKSNFSFEKIKLVIKQEDKDVKKYLFELLDGQRIESVLMYHDYGISICVSSQVGCNMGCKLCESGRRKKVRNLEVHEMVLQILMIEKELGETAAKVLCRAFDLDGAVVADVKGDLPD